MPTTSLRDFDDRALLHDNEPIMERSSHMHGLIRVYPPATAPTDWSNHSWLITTVGTADCPSISAHIKAEHVAFCYDRPHFIDARHRFDETT